MKIDNNKTTEEVQKLGLEAELLNGILNIKEQIYLQTGDDVSMEVLLNFLDNAVYYSEFQIWLADVAEKETSKPERIKALLARTSAGDIVRLYEVSKKYNEECLANSEMTNSKEHENQKILVKCLLEYNRD